MKVLMTTDAVGGVWSYSLDLAAGLRREGVEVVLATMGPAPSADQRRDAAAAPLAALEESSFKLEWMEDPWEDVEAAGEWLLELAEAHDPEVVHLNGFAHATLRWRRPVVAVGHSCVLSWWRAVRDEPVPAHWRRYLEAVRSGLQTADVVVAPSQAMLDELELYYGVRDGLVIHNGSSAPVHAGEPRHPFVLAAGRLWDEAKNLATLDDAARGLRWPVLAAGGGPSGDAVQSLGRLPRDELRVLMERASVFAAPARYEPFGLGPLEAARAGCALVLGDIASLREVWGDAALYADPDDTASIQRALTALMEDDALRAELAARAQQRSRRYPLARMARAYARVYAGVAADRRIAA